MAENTTVSLGAWEDCPFRRFGIDVASVELDSRAAFVLTRIDGQSSIAELCAICGFGEAETLALLSRLVEAELIEIEPVEGDRQAIESGSASTALIDMPPPMIESEQARLAAPSTSPKPRRTRPGFRRSRPKGPDARDLQALRRLGEPWIVPESPTLIGPNRYSGFDFDRRQLLKQSALTINQKRELLFLDAKLGELDHFELFQIETPTDNRKLLKRAYFAFSKSFHPDTFFRKELGIYGPIAEMVFTHGKTIYDRLYSDQELRTVYARVVLARNEAWRGKLKLERRDRDRRKAEEDAAALEAKLDAERIRREEAGRASVTRKADLRARLSTRKRVRRDTGRNPISGRLEKARQFYQDGMAQYESGSFVAAADALRTAMTFDPKNTRFRRAYERIVVKANEIRGEQLWKRGYMEESVGNADRAIVIYQQAVDFYPRADYCVHVAGMMLKEEVDLHKASVLALSASSADPENVDYLVLLGKIYEKVDLVKKALGVYQRALKIDPKHEAAKKALRALKRR